MKQSISSQSRIAHAGIDLELLASSLRHKMDEKGLSLRKAAAAIGCSPATLARLLGGGAARHKADTETLIAAASWLNRGLAHFDVAKRPTRVSLAEVRRYVQALPAFTEDDVRVVMAVIKALQAGKRKRLADH